MLFLIASSLAGCAAPARVGVEYCDHARPVYFDSAAEVDRTPSEVRRQILESNEIWEKLCRRKRAGALPGRLSGAPGGSTNFGSSIPQLGLMGPAGLVQIVSRQHYKRDHAVKRHPIGISRGG